jgi:hypothetical protein
MIVPHAGSARSQIMRTRVEIESAARGEDDSPVVAVSRLKERFFLGTVESAQRAFEAEAEANALNDLS